MPISPPHPKTPFYPEAQLAYWRMVLKAKGKITFGLLIPPAQLQSWFDTEKTHILPLSQHLLSSMVGVLFHCTSQVLILSNLLHRGLNRHSLLSPLL